MAVPLRTVIAATALVAVAGCAASRVGSHIEQGRDFSSYQTYDWGAPDALPRVDPRLDADPYFQDYLLGAVERGLAGRGYRRDESGSPELLIHFHATTANRLAADHDAPDVTSCLGDACSPPLTSSEEATLVFDLLDARTGQPIWRGWAQYPLADLQDRRDRVGNRLNDAVTRLLASLPRGGGR